MAALIRPERWRVNTIMIEKLIARSVKFSGGDLNRSLPGSQPPAPP